MLSRKDLLKSLLIAGAGAALPGMASAQGTAAAPAEITPDDLKAVEKIAGISFTDEERAKIISEVRASRAGFEAVRKQPIAYTTEPHTVFHPIGYRQDAAAKYSAKTSAPKGLNLRQLSDEDIAFLGVRELGHLIRTRQLSPVRLTEIYLARLKRYGDKLLCVVNLTEELARKQAAQAEREIASGFYRGPLHGIPYGIKDLFTVKGYPTTWGANVFDNQRFDDNASVVEKLSAAGAICCAKLSNGTFALGDLWFKGRTLNPFNPKQGSSGSSAGSASATAAGLVAFAIGTETLGSIMSPSTRCRVTGLRPTYGRVSRYGGMALSYTMDKVGPICRQAEDCALVLAAIAGADPNDPSAIDRNFIYPAKIDPKKLKIGYLVGGNADLSDLSGIEREPALKALKAMGAEVRPAKFTAPANGLMDILEVESSSAFEAFTREGEQIRRLNESPWPNTFRAARYVPAVEYLQAQRARTILMQRFEQELGDFDAVFANNVGGVLLQITNLTGTPQICIPWGDDGNGNSISKSFIGRNYEEAKLVGIAKLVQEGARFHLARPDLSQLG